VAIIEGFNHSDVSRLWAEGSRARAIKGSHCSGNEGDKLEQLERKTIPTSEEISLFIIAFL
jgi:hypothetical protein